MSQHSLPSLRLVLFTMQPPLLAKTLVETLGQQVLLMVVAPDPALTHHGIISHAQQDQNILVANDMDQLPALLKGLAPDLILNLDFPLPFPRELLALPRLGCVSVHPSLLPKYRGPRPVFWQFMHGETQTGLTFHRMQSDAYSGPILLQRKLDIAPDDDSRSVWSNLLRLEVSMLPEVLDMVVAGVPGTRQPTGPVSYAPMIGLSERQLDWTRQASHLHNQIRALAVEGVHTLIDGQEMLIYRSRVVDSPKVAASPGTLLACTTEGMLIQTGRDALMVTQYAYGDRVSVCFIPRKQ
jgi:methionyl-tRNA formyltransferase